jgi:hypothetical protein
MEHPFGPFTVPDIRDFVPEKLKPWILVFFVLVFHYMRCGNYFMQYNMCNHTQCTSACYGVPYSRIL